MKSSVLVLFTIYAVLATLIRCQLQRREYPDSLCPRFSLVNTQFMDITFVKKQFPNQIQFKGTLTVLAQHATLGRVQKPLEFTIIQTDKQFEVDISKIEDGWLPVYTKKFLIVPARKSQNNPEFSWYDMNTSHWIYLFPQAGSFCTYNSDFGGSDVVTFAVARAV